MDSTSDSCHYQSNLNNWWCLRLWFSKYQSLSTTTAFFGTSLEQMNQTTKSTSSAVHVLLYSRHWLTYEHTFWCFKKQWNNRIQGHLSTCHSIKVFSLVLQNMLTRCTSVALYSVVALKKLLEILGQCDNCDRI